MAEVTVINQGLMNGRALQRVAAYCRVSSNTADQHNSYARQIRVYTDMIKRNPNWEMVEIFADEGISGLSADKRPEFLRMVRMCELHKIDRIITKSVSRFARNVKEALEYVRKLKILGVGVQFENGVFHDRFVILDYKTKTETFYHCGASSKDAGKRITAINKLGDGSGYYSPIDKALARPSYRIR